jgi:hypothetical protein
LVLAIDVSPTLQANVGSIPSVKRVSARGPVHAVVPPLPKEQVVGVIASDAFLSLLAFEGIGSGRGQKVVRAVLAAVPHSNT